MATKRTLVEFSHDTGYGDHLLSHINSAILGKDMIARRVVETETVVDLFQGSTAVGFRVDEMETRIEFDSVEAAEAAYAILGKWYRQFGPSPEVVESSAKQRRRAMFHSLYEEFGHEV